MRLPGQYLQSGILLETWQGTSRKVFILGSVVINGSLKVSTIQRLYKYCQVLQLFTPEWSGHSAEAIDLIELYSSDILKE